jgi:hypothetical protein
VFWRDEPDKFLQFVFSGKQEFALFLLMYELLNANYARLHLGDTIKRDDSIVCMDFSPYIERNSGLQMLSYGAGAEAVVDEVLALAFLPLKRIVLLSFV